MGGVKLKVGNLVGQQKLTLLPLGELQRYYVIWFGQITHTDSINSLLVVTFSKYYIIFTHFHA